MKKAKSKNKKSSSNMFMWILTASVIIMAFLIVFIDRSKDSRSSANDSVEPGVVLPVASDRE